MCKILSIKQIRYNLKLLKGCHILNITCKGLHKALCWQFVSTWSCFLFSFRFLPNCLRLWCKPLHVDISIWQPFNNFKLYLICFIDKILHIILCNFTIIEFFSSNLLTFLYSWCNLCVSSYTTISHEGGSLISWNLLLKSIL